MDWGHLHLMLNHLPVLGAPALLVLLGWAFARQQPEVVRLALWCTVALGSVTLVVYLTGDSAEEMVEFLPHFDNEMVERHEGLGLAATILIVASSTLAAMALWAPRVWSRLYRPLLVAVLCGLLAGTAAVAATAWTGGPIGHPELRSAIPPSMPDRPRADS